MLEPMEYMRAEIARHMEAAQKRYKVDNDWNIHQEPQIRVGDEVYIDCLQHAAFCFGFHRRVFLQGYSKLLRRTGGPDKVTEVYSHSVVDNEDGSLNIVATDWVIPVRKSTTEASWAINTEKG